jgi:hypothetical protein
MIATTRGPFRIGDEERVALVEAWYGRGTDAFRESEGFGGLDEAMRTAGGLPRARWRRRPLLDLDSVSVPGRRGLQECSVTQVQRVWSGFRSPTEDGWEDVEPMRVAPVELADVVDRLRSAQVPDGHEVDVVVSGAPRRSVVHLATVEVPTTAEARRMASDVWANGFRRSPDAEPVRIAECRVLPGDAGARLVLFHAAQQREPVLHSARVFASDAEAQQWIGDLERDGMVPASARPEGPMVPIAALYLSNVRCSVVDRRIPLVARARRRRSPVVDDVATVAVTKTDRPLGRRSTGSSDGRGHALEL